MQIRPIEDKKTLDISTFINEIKSVALDNRMRNEGNRLFYGKIIIHFNKGELTHIEKNEVLK